MRKIFKILFFLLLIGSLALILEFSGYLYHNDVISKIFYRVNWKKVNKKYKYIIMKATEGKDFLDTDFFYNWNNARIEGFVVGAYHFFSMRSSGESQAEYYISKVPVSDKTLPPIIDIEISTKYTKVKVIKELQRMITKLESHYKKKVILNRKYQ